MSLCGLICLRKPVKNSKTGQINPLILTILLSLAFLVSHGFKAIDR